MFSTTEKYCEDGGHYVLPSTPKVKAKGLWLPMIVILSLSVYSFLFNLDFDEQRQRVKFRGCKETLAGFLPKSTPQSHGARH